MSFPSRCLVAVRERGFMGTDANMTVLHSAICVESRVRYFMYEHRNVCESNQPIRTLVGAQRSFLGNFVGVPSFGSKAPSGRPGQGITMAKNKLVWTAKPDNEDYRSAVAYLSLLTRRTRAEGLVRTLRRAPVVHHSAKDLLRASGLPLLPVDEASVKEDLKKIAKGKALAPVLLIRGHLSTGAPLTVADGYHRICAVCHFDEFAPIAAQLSDP